MRLPLAILLLGMSGCYLYHDITFRVRDAETDHPLAGARVDVSYAPWMYKPRDVSGVTDVDGAVRLPLADFESAAGEVSAQCDGYQSHWGGYHSELPRWPFRDATLHLYREPRPEVVLVVPDDFRGEFEVFEPPPTLIRTLPGTRYFEFQLVPGETVVIRGVPPMPISHSAGISFTSARFKDGRVLSQVEGFHLRRPQSAGEVAVRTVLPGQWSPRGSVSKYLVGTEADLAVARRRLGLPVPAEFRSESQSSPVPR